jgi:4-hydroxy-tetrahydrodipicolinate synthase
MEQPRSDNSAGRPARFGGSIVALATPFRAGAIDTGAVSHLCERQVQRGTAAIVVCGSTGEGPALSAAEQVRMVEVAVEAVAGRVPVIAGCGAPATDAAVALAQSAARAGVAALLCSPPPYVKPTQEGIVAHVRAVARAAGRPVILYDVPGRASVAITDETVARLFEGGAIVAIKDAAGDLSRPPRLRALCGAGLGLLTGDDAAVAGYRAMGGHGCISVTANIAPALCAQLHAAWERGDLACFARLRDLLAPLHDVLFLESNPIPLKAALSVLRLCAGDLRLPLTRASLATRDRLAVVLANLVAAEEEAAGKRARLVLVR